MKVFELPTKKDIKRYCRNCIACCLWSGDVFFKPEKLAGIAHYLRMSERDCAEKYFEVNGNRTRLKARELDDGRCAFVESEGCSIYPFRPGPCRSFPRSWQRPEKELMEQCRLYRSLRWKEKEETGQDTKP